MGNCFDCDRNCKNRAPDCHGTCEKYQAAKKRYAKEQEEIRKKRRKEIDLSRADREGIKHRTEKWRRFKR